MARAVGKIATLSGQLVELRRCKTVCLVIKMCLRQSTVCKHSVQHILQGFAIGSGACVTELVVGVFDNAVLNESAINGLSVKFGVCSDVDVVGHILCVDFGIFKLLAGYAVNGFVGVGRKLCVLRTLNVLVGTCLGARPDEELHTLHIHVLARYGKDRVNRILKREVCRLNIERGLIKRRYHHGKS